MSRNLPKANKVSHSEASKSANFEAASSQDIAQKEFRVCNVYVNMTLKTVASVKYNARGKATMIPALGLEYAGLHCYEKVKTLYDMICIYEMTESFRKPIFQEGYKLSYYPTGQIRLANNFRYTAGSRYTIRYEHKSSKNSTCQWIRPSSVTKEGFSKELEPHEILNATQKYVGIYAEPNVWGSITLWWPKNGRKDSL